MNNKKSTKRALLSSVLSLVLCVTMLIGTTFAWFTDTVTSGKNVIAAGNLDVKLTHSDKDETNVEVTSSEKLFDDVALWEPGAMLWEKFTVSNEGTLDLIYKFELQALNESEVNGHKLSEVLKVAVIEDSSFEYTRQNVAAIASEDWSALSSFAKKGEIKAGASADTYGVVIYWAPSANDNNYNVKDKALNIELGVKLTATQLASESDSFNNLYDDNAQYDENVQSKDPVVDEETNTYYIENAEQLLSLSGLDLKSDAVIEIVNDINYGNREFKTMTAGRGHNLVVNGNGNTISNITIVDGGHNSVGAASMFQVYQDGELTVNNLKFNTVEVTGSGAMGYAAVVIAYNEGVTSINDVDVTNATVKGTKSCGVIAAQLCDGSTTTISNCDVTNSSVAVTEDRAGGLVGRAVDTLAITDSTVDDATAKAITAVEGYANKYIGQRYSADYSVTIDGAEYVDLKTGIASVAAKANKLFLADGEYDVANCGGKTLTINGSKAAVLKLYNEGEDGCDYGFDGSNVTFNGVTIDTTANTGNYKGYARMDATFNDCTFVGSYTTHKTQVFNNCSFDTRSGYIWTWGATAVTFNGCEFGTDSKAILAHGGANTVITINNCNFAATEKGYTGAGDNTAAVEIDPTGTNVYTIKFTGENTITDSYAGWTRIKDGSTGHIIEGVN